MVRIVAGSHRGRVLATATARDLRPTTERVREALFAILGSGAADIAGARVLDGFAGTGALGLEALSRGAGHATFFETDAGARATLADNIATLDEAARTTVHGADATRPPAAPDGGACTLILLDPPWASDLAAHALPALAAAGWLAPGATIVIEARGDDAMELPAGFERHDLRRYGTAALHFFTLSRIST